MAVWGRALVAVAIVVIPGALIVAMGWAVARAVVNARAAAAARAGAARVSLGDVWRELKFRPRLASEHEQAITSRA